jgi:hypothetical protein
MVNETNKETVDNKDITKYLDSDIIERIEQLNIDNKSKRQIYKLIINSHYGKYNNNFLTSRITYNETEIYEFIKTYKVFFQKKIDLNDK